MKRILLVFLCFCFTGLFAQEDAFDQANQAYADADFKKALRVYDSILKNGQTSEELYFNLGNVHYKLKNLAESIFYYEKALQIDPSDSDVKNNLEFAEKRRIDAIEVRPETGLSKLVNEVIASFSVNTWAWFAVSFSFLAAVFFLSYRFLSRLNLKRLFFTLMITSLFFGILTVVFSYQQTENEQQRQFAIVKPEQITVRTEPNPNAGAAFELHEGTKVQLLENFNGFYKIELTDGQVGWLKEKAVKSLERDRF